MKALFLEHPDEPETHRDCDTQTYLGPSLMAAPVVTEGAREREVYFPDVPAAGWTSGPASASPAASAHGRGAARHLPLFVRGGRVVALDPPSLTTQDESSPRRYAVDFPGDGTSAFFFDDGISYAFEHGDWHRLHIDLFTGRRLPGGVRREGERALPYREFEWRFPLAALGDARTVAVDGGTVALDADGKRAAVDGAWLRVRRGPMWRR